MIKVSVIIPIYNGESYLDKCIESLLNQTLRDCEFILVNDGSTDNTLNICNKYKQIDTRIKLINQNNQGVSSARNIGIKSALGEYICFIDCDDYVESDYIEQLYNACINNDVMISACNIQVVTENKNIINKKEMNEGKYDRHNALRELLKFDKFNWGPCGKLFNKTLFDDEIIFPNLKTYEDLVFVYKSIYKSQSVYYISSCNYFYVHREGIGAMKNLVKKPTTDVIVAARKILSSVKRDIPEIWDTSFYGLISQVLMYINDINKVDKKWNENGSKDYIRETQKLLKKYRKDIICNKTIFYKEKILLIIFSYSKKLYKHISSI